MEQETQDMTLIGAEVTVDALERLVQWLYTGKYHLSPPDSAEQTQETYMEMARLFILAEKYVIADLKNDIIDKLFDLQAKQASPPQMPVAVLVYENTPISSPFRQLLAAHEAWHIDPKWYDSEGFLQQLRSIPDFAADVAVQLGKQLNGKIDLRSKRISPYSMQLAAPSLKCHKERDHDKSVR